MTPTRIVLTASVASAVFLLGVERPAALIAPILLAVLVAAVARVGLALLGDVVPGSPDARAARVGAGTFAVAAVLAALLLVLGPAVVPVLAVAVVVVTVATSPALLRPGRPAR